MNKEETLFAAIAAGDRNQVELILTEDPSLLTGRNTRGATPLLWAIYTGQTAVQDAILERHPGLDIWEAAAIGRQARVAELLVQEPELLNAPAPDGFQPLGLAVFFAQAELIRWLLSEGADPNVTAANPMRVRPIHSASAQRDEETAMQLVQLLLDAGAELNVAQHGGWTPLHQAADHGFERLVELLLAHGADPAAMSEDGRTPADMARDKGFTDVAKRLISGRH